MNAGRSPQGYIFIHPIASNAMPMRSVVTDDINSQLKLIGIIAYNNQLLKSNSIIFYLCYNVS